jgi:hypothetical protein
MPTPARHAIATAPRRFDRDEISDLQEAFVAFAEPLNHTREFMALDRREP